MIAEHFPPKAKDIPYESLFQAANDIMLLADANNTIVEANECAVNTYGWPRQELLGRPIDSLRSPRGRFDFPVDMENLRLRGQQFFETEHQTADGRRFPVEVSASLIDDTRGGLLLKIVRDISERKAFEAQIHELAYFDPVTRLANRQLFVDRLTQAIALSRRDGLPLTLLLIGFPDLRRYAFLEEGAKNLAKEAAKRLLDCIRAEDSVGRISDGEFALLLHADARGAERVATQILARFADPFPFGDKEVIVECDIGIACYPDDGRSSEDLLSAALVALLPALSEKGSTYNFHTPSLGHSAHRRLEIETHLRRALTQGELFLHYQPQIDVVTGRMVSVEALMRWQHPVWGWVSPAEFIPVAEDCGLIDSLGDWALETALGDASLWRDQGVDLRVAVNLSAIQLRDPHLLVRIRRCLDRHGLAASALEIEVTESTAMRDVIDALTHLHDFTDAGIHLAIDDFGTGYSSLASLKNIRVGLLKLDTSFVSGLPEDAENAAIAAAIIRMADALGARTLAEGVETREQFDWLRAQGCHLAQGWLFARALPAVEIPALFHRNFLLTF